VAKSKRPDPLDNAGNLSVLSRSGLGGGLAICAMSMAVSLWVVQLFLVIRPSGTGAGVLRTDRWSGASAGQVYVPVGGDDGEYCVGEPVGAVPHEVGTVGESHQFSIEVGVVFTVCIGE